MNIQKLMLIILPVCLIGCKEPETKTIYSNDTLTNLLLRKVYDDDNNLILQETLSKDSINDGTFRKWDSNHLAVTGQYSKGKKDGNWIYFYSNGDTLQVESWLFGHQFGEQFEYYENNNLKSYLFVDTDNKTIYSSNYDTFGKITMYRGSPIFLAYSSAKISRGELFTLIYFFGVPPNMKYDMLIKEIDLNTNSVISTEKSNSSTPLPYLDTLHYGKRILIYKEYKKIGNYKWTVQFKLTDTLNNIIIANDTLNLIISVI